MKRVRSRRDNRSGASGSAALSGSHSAADPAGASAAVSDALAGSGTACGSGAGGACRDVNYFTHSGRRAVRRLGRDVHALRVASCRHRSVVDGDK